MAKKKLIVCSPQLGLSPQSDLGGEVHDREIIRAFCDLGIKVVVILPKNKPYLRHKNLKVYFLPLSFIWPPYLFNFLIIPYLFWLYKKEKFSLLRVHSPYFVGLGALFFKLFYPQIPLVATYHHWEEKKPFFRLIDKLLIKFWDQIIVVSDFTKRELTREYKVPKEKISVIYNGLDKKFRKQKKKKELMKKYQPKDKKILLYLGRLEKRKNVDFLIKLIDKINNEKVKLIIAGQGRLLDSLKNEARKYNLADKIVFPGFIPEDKKVDYYNLADIFLFPSRKEGFGLSVLEASSCGLPVIVSHTSSLEEVVIDTKTGFLAKVNDLTDWKEKIKKLLENESLRKRMGQNGQKFAQEFSWEKTAQKQINIFTSLVTNSL